MRNNKVDSVLQRAELLWKRKVGVFPNDDGILLFRILYDTQCATNTVVVVVRSTKNFMSCFILQGSPPLSPMPLFVVMAATILNRMILISNVQVK